MAEMRAPESPGPEKEEFDEPIEVAGVPLVVWAVRLSLFLLLQGAIVLASYAYYGFGTDPSQFGPGFRLDAIHASINFLWGLVGSVIGFFAPRFSIDYLLAFALFFTAIAALGSFGPEHFGLQLGPWAGLTYWLLAIAAWILAIYALWQGCIESDPPEA